MAAFFIIEQRMCAKKKLIISFTCLTLIVAHQFCGLLHMYIHVLDSFMKGEIRKLHEQSLLVHFAEIMKP